MPNFCDNDLVIHGPKEILLRFKETAKGNVNGKDQLLDMNSFIPYPEEFREQDRIASEHNAKIDSEIENMSEEDRLEYLKKNPRLKGGYSWGGYDWCCDNWGTKWNFWYPVLAHEEDEYMHYEFITAWSPPIPVVTKMGEMFPELTFELSYFESSMELNGRLVVEGGKVTRDQNAKYFGRRGG